MENMIVIKLNTIGSEVGKYSIGQLTDKDGIFEDNYYSVFARDRKLKNITLILSDSYSERKNVFCGKIIIENQEFKTISDIQPDLIKCIFGELVDSWDDDVEVNNQYIRNEVRWEFSWHHKDNKLIPNYISVGNDT
jgi:hypothetical protein